MIKFKDSTGKVVGTLSDEDSEPKFQDTVDKKKIKSATSNDQDNIKNDDIK